jgi:hypothetical protein
VVAIFLLSDFLLYSSDDSSLDETSMSHTFLLLLGALPSSG